MKLINKAPNCQFLEDGPNKHCFSYGHEVAAILKGKYMEFQGEKYYSRTSCKHKKMFREYYGY